MKYKNRLQNIGGDQCVCCGTYVPEGRQVCDNCANGIPNKSKKRTLFSVFKRRPGFDFMQYFEQQDLKI